MLIPLHVKSHYSLAYGTASPEQLVTHAASAGLPALALTDLESLSGQLEFHDLCRRAGIRPITGVELRPPARGVESRRGRVVLLARDACGYANLCRILGRRWREGDAAAGSARRRVADPVNALAGLSEGLFVLTDDWSTMERLLRVPDLAREQLRWLLVRPGDDGAESQWSRLAAAAGDGILVAADGDIVYLNPADRDLHVLQIAVRRRRDVTETAASGDAETRQRWFRAPAQYAQLFADAPGAVEETHRIAEQCRLELPLPRAAEAQHHLFGAAAPSLLAQACERELRRAREAGRCKSSAYDARLAMELTVIDSTHHSSYFLAASEVAHAARLRGIPVATRGSAVASLVVHLLGISSIDPVAGNLYFERFLHLRRVHPPEIDLDVCSERRDELIDWVYRRFGPERVALAGVHQCFRRSSALRRGLTALGFSPARVEALCALQARAPVAADGGPASVAARELPAGLALSERAAMRLSLRLVGKPRQLAMHPGGVVLADELATHVPIVAGARGLGIAQYDALALGRMRLVKLDLLGSRFLTQVAETLRLAAAAGPGQGARAVTWPPPLDDVETLARLDRADTIGCFQVETPTMRALLAKVPVHTLEDCVAALALVRPGAAGDATKADYIRVTRGESTRGAHPLFAALLPHTHGLVLYDEDLMTVLAHVGQLTLAAADDLRAEIIDAGDDAQALAALERRLLGLAPDTPATARAAWRAASRFASYSFSRAHAWSYAVLAYQAAFLRTHHPLEFGCALLNHYGGAYPLRSVAADLVRSGIEIAGPSVNRSGLATAPEAANGRRRIRIGLSRIKHLSRQTALRIVNDRGERGPFASMEDLLVRVQPARCETTALVRSGACDALAPLSRDAYPFAHEALLAGLAAKQGRTGQRPAPAPAPGAAPEHVEMYAKLMRMRNELEFLGMHLADHPMRVLRREARARGCLTSREIEGLAVGSDAARVRFAGILAANRRHSRTEGALQFLSFEDEEGLIEGAIRPAALRQLAGALGGPGPYVVEGYVRADRGYPHLEVTALHPFVEHRRMGVPA